MFSAVSSSLFTGFTIAMLVLPVLALGHMVQHKFTGRHRLVWLLIILFLPFFGPILYFIMGKKYRQENPE